MCYSCVLGVRSKSPGKRKCKKRRKKKRSTGDPIQTSTSPAIRSHTSPKTLHCLDGQFERRERERILKEKHRNETGADQGIGKKDWSKHDAMQLAYRYTRSLDSIPGHLLWLNSCYRPVDVSSFSCWCLVIFLPWYPHAVCCNWWLIGHQLTGSSWQPLLLSCLSQRCHSQQRSHPLIPVSHPIRLACCQRPDADIKGMEGEGIE